MIFKAKSKEIVVVRVILLLALVLATIMFIKDVNLTGLTTSANQTNELPVWEGNDTWQISKNSNTTFDLNDYFKDPNYDTLTYLATEADKISIIIIDNLLTISPAQDFAGERTISILASDEFDAIKINVKILVGTEEERALSPINITVTEETIEEINITEPEINISEQNITNQTQIENASNISALETQNNRSIKKFNKDEKIKDENNKHVGKKVEDEISFDTFFTKIQKNETELLVEFYHDSTEQQPVWIEGDITYTLSKDTAEPLENIILIVPRVKGIVPKFKLHIGTESDVFEFGKTIPDVIFNGESILIDRDDEKIDIELTKESAKAEIKGAVDVTFMNAKVTNADNQIIKTDIFAANNLEMEHAIISLPKQGNVNTIMECTDFNLITDSCPSSWVKTNIPFTENSTHITFTVDHFSGYGGAEINILNVQSYPVVGGEWTVGFTTTGTANLTITATNETTWSNTNENNDLKFLEIKCGDTVQSHQWINNKVFIQDYNCAQTSYEKSKVITAGEHTLEFNFGGDVKYARNYAQSYWSAKYNVTGPGAPNWGDFGQQVVFDSNQDVIMTGYSQRESGAWISNWFTIKYNSTGTILWNQTIDWIYSDGHSRGQAYALDVDSDNNITVVGDNGTYAAIVKYNSTGSHLWNKSFKTPYHVSAINRFYDVDIDYDNNITAVGRTFSSPTDQGMIMRFDSQGNPLWNVTGLPGIIKGVGVDSEVNIYAGSSNGTLFKYNSTGSQLWNITFNVSGISYNPDIRDVAVDSDDNITVVGTYWNSTENRYVFVVDKYNSSGYLLWNYEYVGLISGGGAYRVDTASNNEIAVIGVADINNTAFRKSGGYFTVRLNSSGVQEWNNSYGYMGVGTDYGRGVAINEYGEIAVTGNAIYSWIDTGEYAFTIKYATLNNTGPTTQQIVVNQTATGDLTCYAEGTDNEESTITAYYYWTYQLPVGDGKERATIGWGEIAIPVNTLSLVSTIEDPQLGVKYNCNVKFFDSSEQELLWSSNNYTRYPICGDTLNQNTENFLLQDVTTTTDCFTLGGHNISLDCQGFAIRGDLTASGDYAIYCNDNAACGNNFTMRNCYVENFSQPLYRYFSDSYFYNNTFFNQYDYNYISGGSGNNFTSNNFTNQRKAAASAGAVLYFSSSDRNILKNNYFFNNAGYDIYFTGNSDTNTILNNTIDASNKNKYTVYTSVTGGTVNTATFENNTIINQGTAAGSWAYYFQNANTPYTFIGNNDVDGENMSEYFYYNKNNLLLKDLSKGKTNIFNWGQIGMYLCDNVTIKNSLFENHSKYEIYMREVSSLSILNNTLNEGTLRTIYGFTISNATIENNTMITGGGIQISGIKGVTINNNTIKTTSTNSNALYLQPKTTTDNNLIIKENNLDGINYGIHTYISDSNVRLYNLSIYNNWITDSGTGIYVQGGSGSSNDRFYNANVYNNTVYDTDDGISLTNLYTNLTFNNISDCGSSINNEGILIAARAADVSNNSVNNCGVGIYINQVALPSNIYKNDLSNNAIWGIRINPGNPPKYLRQNITQDNLINNKPPYYYFRQDGLVLENMSLRIGRGVSTGVITVVDSKNVKINNNTFASNASAAATGLASGIGIFNMSNSVIENNTINSTEFAIEVHSSFSVTSSANYIFKNNTIRNNLFTNSTEHLLFFLDGAVNISIINNTFSDGSSSKSAIHTNINAKNIPDYINISNNRFNDLSTGIYLSAGTNNKPNRMDIGNNIFTNIVQYAMRLESSVKDNVIHNNNITNITKSSGTASGVYITGSATKNNTIRDNFINNSWRGIVWVDTAANNTAYNNQIYNSRDTGLYVDPFTTTGPYVTQQIFNNTVCYGKDAITFTSNFGFGNTRTHNNTFCIVNMNPLNGTNTTDTQFGISFNATNVFNETNTSCSLFIDNVFYGINKTTQDNFNTTITMTSAVDFGWHNLSINCTDAHNNTHVSNTIEFEALDDNIKPNTEQIFINSTYATNFTHENITCWVNITDAENTSLIAHYNWYNETVLFSSGILPITSGDLVNLSTIHSSNTSNDETWTCEVKGWDGSANETDWNNASILIKSCGAINRDTILSEKVTANNNCFNIAADNIIFDCNGYSIIGNGSLGVGKILPIGINVSDYSNVTIKNCIIANFTTNIFIDPSYNNTIINNFLENATNCIFLNQTNSTLVINNSLYNCSFGIRLSESHANNLTQNIINLSGEAIRLEENSRWNYVVNNTIYNTSLFGTNYGIRIKKSHNTTVSYNTLYRTGGNNGIYVDRENTQKAANNTISYNYLDFSSGIYAGGFTNNIYEFNIINNSKGVGIETDQRYITIRNNTIENSGKQGIAINANGAYISISGNKISFSTTDGIFMDRDTTDINITDNDIFNNSGHGIKRDSQGGSGTRNRFINNRVYNNTLSGIYLAYTQTDVVINNTILSNQEYGIKLNQSLNNNLSKNIVKNHSYSIYFANADSNKIYNNYFENKPYSDASSTNNDWEQDKTAGTNIINGQFLGGNFWLNYNGTDTDFDGLGNTEIPWTGITQEIVSGGDSLPLVSTYVQKIECEFESSGSFTSCSGANFSSNITQMRVNCSDSNILDGIETMSNATFNLTNLYDNTNFVYFNTSTQSGGYFVLDNSNVQIQDSGTWEIRVACTDTNGLQRNGTEQFTIAFGNITSVSIILPNSTAINVTEGTDFTITTQFQCTGGECVNTTVTLDPEKTIIISDLQTIQNEKTNPLDILRIILMLLVSATGLLIIVKPKKKATWIMLVLMLVLLVGCDEEFVLVQEPLSVTVGDIIAINITVNSTTKDGGGTSFPKFGLQIPKNWTLINYTVGIPYFGAVNGNFNKDTDTQNDVASNYGNRSGYQWYGMVGQSGVDPAADSLTTGTVYINITQAGSFYFDYVVGNGNDDWTDNVTGSIITASDPATVTINSITMPAFGIGGNANCIANVTSSNTISKVLFNITQSNLSLIELGNGTENSDLWTSTNFLAGSAGQYNCTILGVDSSGNSLAGSANFTAGNKGIIPMNSGSPFYTINQNPVYSINQSCLLSMIPGQVCNSTWNVTANASAGTTWEFFSIYNGTEVQLNTSKLNVTIDALPVSPVSPTSGGGGGGGATRVIKGGVNFTACVESWTCGFWTPCTDGVRLRYCSDVSKCGTEDFKPLESKECGPPKTKPIIEKPAPINSIKIIAPTISLFKWISDNICFILTILSYLALIIAATFAVVYFLTRNYFEQINKYITTSIALTAIAGLILMIKYAICKEMLLPALLAIAGIVGIFILDTIVTAIFRKTQEYWKYISHKKEYSELVSVSGKVKDINKAIERKIKKIPDKETFKKRITLPKLEIRKRVENTLDKVGTFNSSLKQKIKRIQDKFKPKPTLIPIRVESAKEEIARISKRLDAGIREELGELKKLKKTPKLIIPKIEEPKKSLKTKLRKEIEEIKKLPKHKIILPTPERVHKRTASKIDRFNKRLKEKLKALTSKSKRTITALKPNKRISIIGQDIDRSLEEIRSRNRQLKQEIRKNKIKQIKIKTKKPKITPVKKGEIQAKLKKARSKLEKVHNKFEKELKKLKKFDKTFKKETIIKKSHKESEDVDDFNAYLKKKIKEMKK